MNFRVLLFLLLFMLPGSSGLSQETSVPPAIAGYVTRVGTPTDFDVNGSHILCDSSTKFSSVSNDTKVISPIAPNRYIGEAIDVYGRANKKTHTIAATKVVADLSVLKQFSGTAVISLLPSPDNTVKVSSGELLLRADGYLILITPKTRATFDAPLTSLSGVTTNTWITYQGKLRPDGVLLAESAAFRPNTIPRGEDKLRTKSEYDPKAVDPKDKQSGTSKFFLGTNVKKIPPYNDPAMQSRIDRIGASLIPSYQRNLLASDETKIDFRFQLIDYPKWRDARTLPNGIIVVPRQVVERLQNDSQLATVLADNIASAIEKQSYRQLPAARKMTAAQLASAAGGVFVPGLGLATGLANAKIASTIQRHAEEQSGRISLMFLHDAGYDIHEAPVAWWLLSSKKPRKPVDIPLPERAAYLYSVLGRSWHTLPGSSTAATSSTAAIRDSSN